MSADAQCEMLPGTSPALSPKPSEKQASPQLQLCNPQDLLVNTSQTLLPEAYGESSTILSKGLEEYSTERRASSQANRLERKRRAHQPHFNDLFAELATATEVTAKTNRRTRRGILQDAIRHIQTLELVVAQRKRELSASDKLHYTFWDMQCPGRAEYLHSALCDASDLGCGQTTKASEFNTETLEQEEPESEAATLLELLPRAYQAAEALCISTSEP